MKNILRSIIIKIKYIIWAIKRIIKPHLGDEVLYNEIKCSLIQGVSNPYWDLLPLTIENLNKDKREIFKHVHTSNFKLQYSLKRCLFVLKSDYKFKMSNWYSIDTNRKLSNLF